MASLRARTARILQSSDSDSSEEQEEKFVDAESLLASRKTSTAGSVQSTDDEGGFQSPRSHASKLSSERSFQSLTGRGPPRRAVRIKAEVKETQVKVELVKETPELGRPMWAPLRLFQGPEDPGSTARAQPQGRYPQPTWAEPWSVNASVQSSVSHTELFQPLRNSAQGKQAIAAALKPPGPAMETEMLNPLHAHNGDPNFRAPLRRTISPHHSMHRRWASASRQAPPGYSQDPEGPGPHHAHYPPINHVHGGVPAGGPLQSGPAAAAGPTTKLARRDAWAKFLAYEGCLQVCLAAHMEQVADAEIYLQDGCSALRTAFGFENLLLKPAVAGGPPAGATIIWDDADVPPLPTVEFTPATTRQTVIKVTATKLASSELYRPMASRIGMFGKHQEQQYICLHADTHEGDNGSWIMVGPHGEGANGDVVDLGAADQEGDLIVEVHNYDGVVAQGSVCIDDLWKVAGEHNSLDFCELPRRRTLLQRLCCRPVPLEDDVYGKQWVQVYDAHGNRYGHVLLATWMSTSDHTVMAHTSTVEPPPLLTDGFTHNAKGYQQITSWQVYDITLDAALRAQDCGPRRLAVTGEWKWLLAEFANVYGIRDSYAVLAHLRWMVKPENATVTAQCLELMGAELGPLKTGEAEGGLLPQELAILSRIEIATEALLAECFENYYSLSEAAPSGILDGGMAAPESPAPALLPAVELCNILRDVLKPKDSVWMTERFRIAACRRYQRLNSACEEEITGNDIRSSPPRPQNHRRSMSAHYHAQDAGAAHGQADEAGGPHDAEAELAYARLEALCQAIKNELQNDLRIHDSAVLPSFVVLPQVTAAEYCREFVAKLDRVLRAHPPPQPSRPAVDLLVTVGQQQEYLAWHNLLPPAGSPGELDALRVFGPHVDRWINGSAATLCHRCRVIEASTYATAVTGAVAEDGKTQVAPLVGEMLQRIQSEVNRYERVITYWPIFGPQLEGAVCTILRETTAAVSRQCGLIPVQDLADLSPFAQGQQPPTHRTPAKFKPHLPGDTSPRHWRFAPSVPVGPNAPPGGARTNIMPHEAVLLNSLRRLLTVVPQTESLLSRWAGGPAGPPGTPPLGQASPATGHERQMEEPAEGPHLGAQFAQLVKELRSEYAAAVTNCAERIATALFVSQGRSIHAILQRYGLTGTPAIMQQQVGPVLEAMEDVLVALTRSLDGRVYVALGRGLWDFTAKDIYDYTEALQEGKENKGAWRGRQNAAAALDVVDNFFTAVLSGTLQHELQSKDLDLPLHSDKAHKLLAENTAAINMSYTVY
ncbi:hypothetical protein WJX72_001747 [[Myrmecia] bisecta]|uniref:Uncharacterized protein n=1 Tax=[Myrmecia] bisecta TaxID=41462 RepID=A0AAW1PFY0_9CHLO